MADLRLLAPTHLMAAGAGFAVAPREILESTVASSGFFQVDTKRVLSAAVESLRAENKLLVYGFHGYAAVSVDRDGYGARVILDCFFSESSLCHNTRRKRPLILAPSVPSDR